MADAHVANYVNPESRVWEVISTVIVCSVISTTLMSARLFVRLKMLRSAGWDDLAAVFATLMLLSSCVLSILSTHHGYGKHVWDVRPDQIANVYKLVIAKCVIYNPAMFAIRMSVLFFYLRVFAYPTFRKLVYAMMGLTTVSTIAFIFGAIMRCIPLAFSWDKSIPGGHCGDQRLFIYFNASASIILDLMIWGLPIPILLGLGFNQRKKYALYLVFSIGLFASLASVFRLRVLWVVDIRKDPTWTNVIINMWSQIEITASIACACLPPLKPVFCLVFRGFLGPCDETCGSTAPPGRMQPLHVDSALQDSIVQVERDEEMRIGTAYSTHDTTCSTIGKEKEMDVESAVEIVNDEVNEKYPS